MLTHFFVCDVSPPPPIFPSPHSIYNSMNEVCRDFKGMTTFIIIFISEKIPLTKQRKVT